MLDARRVHAREVHHLVGIVDPTHWGAGEPADSRGHQVGGFDGRQRGEEASSDHRTSAYETSPTRPARELGDQENRRNVHEAVVATERDTPQAPRDQQTARATCVKKHQRAERGKQQRVAFNKWLAGIHEMLARDCQQRRGGKRHTRAPSMQTDCQGRRDGADAGQAGHKGSSQHGLPHEQH